MTAILKMPADKIGKISMFSDFNGNVYLWLFWSAELIGNDENCIQGHFYFQNGRQQNLQNFNVLWFQWKLIFSLILKWEHWYFADFVGDLFENKNDPEYNFHHYQSIPHFKIRLNINFHWNQRTLKFCRFCWRPFWK
jgi:hypothetical protein